MILGSNVGSVPRSMFRAFLHSNGTVFEAVHELPLDEKLMDRTLFLGELINEIGDPQHVGKSSVDT